MAQPRSGWTIKKRKLNRNVDLLIGAVNVWCWDRNAVPLVREMQAAGIERILWSNQQSPENLKALNELGVLTSRYDIYQDVMAPTNFPRLRWIHPDWTTNAWSKDIMTCYGLRDRSRRVRAVRALLRRHAEPGRTPARTCARSVTRR